MRNVLLSILLTIAALTPTPSSAQHADDLIRLAADSIAKHDFAIFDEQSQSYLEGEGHQQIERLQQLGIVRTTIRDNDDVAAGTWTASGRAIHENGVSDWRLRFYKAGRKIRLIDLTTTLIGEKFKPYNVPIQYRDLAPSAPEPSLLDPCSAFPALCSDAAKGSQVEFLYATTRQQTTADNRVSYSGERPNPPDEMSFGAARVHVPKGHLQGKIELASASWLNWIYQVKSDPDKHFIIEKITPMSQDDWGKIIDGNKKDEALVFVHGYNTSFDEALYRMAQIIYDMKYDFGLPVLFTWASRGGQSASTLEYSYDRESAMIARSSFLRLLKILEEERGIKRVHVLAHSMGNLLVMDALREQAALPNSPKVAELMMAAPDIDRDQYRTYAPEVRKLVSGMTLYASSADRALIISREISGGVPRAGSVTEGEPIVLQQIDSIDVTAAGNDILGLNHDVFAGAPAVMNDIYRLLTDNPRMPPDRREVEIRGVPEAAHPPRFWRYVP
jgi:esterase/lipase superfamily enzyme